VVVGRTFVLLALLSAGVACGKRSPSAPAPIACFDVTAQQNSPGTLAVFEARKCQGGGVTWGAILEVVAARQGRVRPVDELLPGWTGGVYLLDDGTRFSLDDEGDAVRFCSDGPALFATMRREIAHLNGDGRALAQAMGAAKALALECLEADGTTPKLPPLNPPPALPPALLAAARAALVRLQEALARQPVWCFPPDDYASRTGALRFFANGQVTWTAPGGEVVGRGHWQLPREELEDDRIEVNVERVPGAQGRGVSLLEHFNLGETGRIGFDLIGDNKIARSEMTPGDGCLASPAKHLIRARR
jgi:hypothetical protein